MTSHRCVPGRVDSAKKHHVYYSIFNYNLHNFTWHDMKLYSTLFYQSCTIMQNYKINLHYLEIIKLMRLCELFALAFKISNFTIWGWWNWVHVRAELRGTLVRSLTASKQPLKLMNLCASAFARTSQKTEYMHIPPTLNQQPHYLQQWIRKKIIGFKHDCLTVTIV